MFIRVPSTDLMLLTKNINPRGSIRASYGVQLFDWP